MKNGTRMRIERDRGCLCAYRFCPFGHGLHYHLMAKMEAVKHAKRQNCRPLYIRILSSVIYLHR